jgi:hypothetical protein
MDVKHSSAINRRILLLSLATLPALSTTLLPSAALAQAPGGLLPSWNEGAAKQAIFDFVRLTTDRSSPSYVAPEERIAVFGTAGGTTYGYDRDGNPSLTKEPSRSSCSTTTMRASRRGSIS